MSTDLRAVSVFDWTSNGISRLGQHNSVATGFPWKQWPEVCLDQFPRVLDNWSKIRHCTATLTDWACGYCFLFHCPVSAASVSATVDTSWLSSSWVFLNQSVTLRSNSPRWVNYCEAVVSIFNFFFFFWYSNITYSSSSGFWRSIIRGKFSHVLVFHRVLY